MIVSYSQTVHSALLAIEEQASIGRIADVVLQKTDLKVKGLILSVPFFFIKPRIVTFDDIIDFDKNAVVIQSAENAVPLAELVSIQQAINSGMRGVKHKVFTKQGKFVGNVYDYTFESSSGLIYSLYVKRLVTDRIIPRTVICELNEKGFIIDDDFELVRNASPYPEQA